MPVSASDTARPEPASVSEAVTAAVAALRWLARADLASVPVSVQAEALRGLEQAMSAHTAARARALAAFCAQAGFEEDGHGSPRTWLTWQTRVTRPAAAATVASMRRLAAHPAVTDALRDGVLSASWARMICDWTERLPGDHRDDADAILVAAAAAGAGLDDLAALAEEIRRRVAPPDRDPDGFEERGLHLATTLGGAGKLWGDLTPQAAAALQAVLDTLGKKAGPEDSRTRPQRDHDALEEACRRLAGSGCQPDRAGQPTQIQLTMTLDDLASGIAADGDPLAPFRDHPAAPATGCASGPAPTAGPGHDCDAAIAPIVTGRVDHELLDQLTDWLAGRGAGRPGGQAAAPAGTSGGWAAARDLLLSSAVQLLSGPGGLTSWLRTGTLAGQAASVSLPLDLGTPTEVVPPHLRRAVIARDKHCSFPGCDQPPQACQVHHIRPRSKGGLTKLANLTLLCSFHHLIAVHRWGWVVRLNADGTTTAASTDGRVFHSHSPPGTAAA